MIAADKTLQALNNNPGKDVNLSNVGDVFMLANHYPGKTEMQIRKLFGSGFTELVFELEPGIWHGTVLSGYGTHLVFVDEHIKNELPTFTEVREYVMEDWNAEKKDELEHQYIDGLLARCEVVVEGD